MSKLSAWETAGRGWSIGKAADVAATGGLSAPPENPRLIQTRLSALAYEAIGPLLQTEAFDRLMATGVLTPVASSPLRDGGMLFEQPRPAFSLTADQWPATAWKRSALATVDLNLMLAEHGYTLRSGRHDAITLQGHQPCIDWLNNVTALNEATAERFVREFAAWVLHPAQLMACGQRSQARALLRADRMQREENTVDPRLASRQQRTEANAAMARKVFDVRAAHRHRAMPESIETLATTISAAKSSHLSFAEQWRVRLIGLRQRIESMEVRTPPANRDRLAVSRREDLGLTLLKRSFRSLVSRLGGDTLLEIGASADAVSASVAGGTAASVRALVMDTDERMLDHIDTLAAQRGLNMGAAHVDIETLGDSSGGEMSRLAADTVITRDLFSPLDLRDPLRADRLAQTLAQLTRRHLAIQASFSDDALLAAARRHLNRHFRGVQFHLVAGMATITAESRRFLPTRVTPPTDETPRREAA